MIRIFSSSVFSRSLRLLNRTTTCAIRRKLIHSSKPKNTMAKKNNITLESKYSSANSMPLRNLHLGSQAPAPSDFSELLEGFAVVDSEELRRKSFWPLGYSLPLVGRQQEIQKCWDLSYRHWQARHNPTLKEGHFCLFAIGALGIGKTRFGCSFDKELLAYGNSLENKTDDIKEFLEHLQNVAYVRIDLGHTHYEYQKKYQYEDSLQWKLVTCAVYGALGIKISYDQFALQLQSSLGNELPSWFTLPHLGKYLCNCTGHQKSTVYWHWDEFDVAVNSPQEVARTLYQLKQAFTSPDYFALLLVSGTKYASLEEAIERLSTGNWSPSYVLKLRLLAYTEVQSLVKRVQDTHPWLQNALTNSQTFKRLLLSTGGVPALIESLLLIVQRTPLLHKPTVNESDIATLTTALKAYASWHTLRRSFHKSALLALANRPILLNPETEQLLVHGLLHTNGNIYSMQLQPVMPFLYLQANAWPLEVKGLENLVATAINPSMQLHSRQLPTLSLWRHIVTINSLCELGITTTSLSQLFNQSIMMGIDIAIKLKQQFFARANSNSFDPLLPQLVQQGQLRKEHIYSYTIFNGDKSPGPSGLQYVQGEDGHTYLLAFCTNVFDGEVAEIIKEVDNIAREVEMWQSNQKEPELIHHTYVVVFTNKKFEPSFARQLITRHIRDYMETSYVVVNTEQHMGCLSTILPSKLC